MSSPNEEGPVVVGVDGSQPALNAVRWACAEAVARGSTLRLVSALGTRAEYGYGPRRSWGNIYDEIVDDTSKHLDVAAAVAREVADKVGSVEIDTLIRTGHPAQVLAEQALDASLLVVGHRGLTGLPGLFAGSVAVRMAATAPCPLVVVGDLVVPRDRRPVVLGVDGTERSEAAIAFAFAEADRWRSPLIAVHAWLDQVLDPRVAAVVDWERTRTEERSLLAQRLAGWSEKFPDVPVRKIVQRDRAAHALLQQSADAGLLVVGSRGRGALSGSLLGSVSHTVLHRCPCPVAVVHPEPGVR